MKAGRSVQVAEWQRMNARSSEVQALRRRVRGRQGDQHRKHICSHSRQKFLWVFFYRLGAGVLEHTFHQGTAGHGGAKVNEIRVTPGPLEAHDC